MSDFVQTSFKGGMNLLLDDTRLDPTQYRVAFNVRNRYDVLDGVLAGKRDVALSAGIKQELITFGEYIVVFVAGFAYYRRYTSTGWTLIENFKMSSTAPRYWTATVPLAATNYGRQATDTNDSLKGVASRNSVAGAFAGNVPGLLVQDNISQPQFIYLDENSLVKCRTMQSYAEWSATYVADELTVDKREYVPIGNAMAWCDGILYVASQDRNAIYRSVSGRPLDFVVNVKADGSAGGDATTTSYTVGVGGISALRAMQDGSLFVAASNANFLVSKNTTPNAPTMWGEYTFIRRYLFEATCLSDRVIIDSLGDTRFIDLTGVRSFNAIQQLQNEGRNSPFTATIASAFKGIIQSVAAAILYDNYEFYSVTTTYGDVIAVYDTLLGCWTAFDDAQVGGAKIKAFAKIELGVMRLYAITDDDQLYTLFESDQYAPATVVTQSVTTTQLYNNENVKLANSKSEIKLNEFRCILNHIVQDSAMTLTFVTNNRMSPAVPTMDKLIRYVPPKVYYNGSLQIPYINSQLTNIFFSMPNMEQGWKTYVIMTWSGSASIVQYGMSMIDQTPMNPLRSQTTTI